MAAIAEDRFRLTRLWDAPGSAYLGNLPAPAPVPDLRERELRVLQDVINWQPTTPAEVSESLKMHVTEVNRSAADLQEKGLITRERRLSHDPFVMQATAEGRRVAKILEKRREWDRAGGEATNEQG